ncbi:MAG TPA: hypothetical protein VMS55_07710 [Myxococcota bacterium]|nr:hypothetical protein [Myxococcota bacterium]
MRTAILEEIFDAARAGDRARFDRLFDVWFQAVYRWTLRRVEGSRLRAELLTQQILIDCVNDALTPPDDALRADESTKDRVEDVQTR